MSTSLRLISAGENRPGKPASACSQPAPYDAQVIVTIGGGQTGIVRHWNHGDTKRCRLCPQGRCVAKYDSCFLMVAGTVEADDALLFDSNDLAWPAT